MKLSDIKDKIEKNAITIATVDGNKPHAIAVAFAKVVDNKIIITDNYMNLTPKVIQKNPNVSLVVFSRNWEDDCWGFAIEGKAKYETSGKWAKFVKEMPENKGYAAKGVIIVTPAKIKRLS